ncbi:unnamed protein product [Anisakis simplex]|uniref:PC4 domain-containing protein n=1 Tax=Anisakis simplex TaxID=6269 RepID=A0A0M3K9J2_ANISI|nr:unnamed protein product [Anisakis simplex]
MSSDSDSSFEEQKKTKKKTDSDSSSEEQKKTKKKTTTQKDGQSSKKRKTDKDEQESSSDEGVIDKTPIKKTKQNASKHMKNSDGDEMLELGKMRFVTVRSFKGKALIDIREYYQDKSGEIKPGRKGISLSREQYQNFKELTSEIDERLREV